MPGHLQCTGSDVFTQPCRHSLRGSGQRVTRTDLIREQLLHRGWAVLCWSKEARLELDFLASSFRTGTVAHKQEGDPERRTGGKRHTAAFSYIICLRKYEDEEKPGSWPFPWAALTHWPWESFISHSPSCPSSPSPHVEIYEGAGELLHLCCVWADKKLLRQQHVAPAATISPAVLSLINTESWSWRKYIYIYS